MNELLQSIKGVGPKREKQLHQLGIHSVTQLLNYFPRAYEDRSKIYSINQLVSGDLATIVGKVIAVQEKKPRPRLSILEITVSDGTGTVRFVLFNQGYKKNFYKKGDLLCGYGKVEKGYGCWQINSPHIEQLRKGVTPELGIIPIYPLVEGVSQFIIRHTIHEWFSSHSQLTEIIPMSIRNSRKFLPRYEALKEIHFPSSVEAYELARKQLAYEELFIMQSGLALLRYKQQVHEGLSMANDGILMEQFRNNLPFRLTNDQLCVIQDISSDMQSDKPMQRLVQGDVGSGKTVVAVLALLKAVENGYQGCLMAPTEILAQQHFDSISSMCKKLPVRIALLTGALKGKEREYLYEQVSEGTIDILIGTHAVIQETVKFKSLGIGIVDEQHRFGVEQRSLLQRKGRYPHVLIMSATPIPRTMTLSIYGDLDVSIIKEMPPGRKPVLTYKVNSSYKKRLLAFFRKEMSLGHQIYIVCPLVEESEKLDLQAAENLYLELIEYFGDSIAVGLVHGRMPASEKETIMSQFKSGAIQLLVSTTVIEVGVNVPNATVICIEGAERFGLAQLHQLRGRVGRGITQSYCILVSDSTSEAAQERLQLMTHIQDGFELAEQDLLLRGSGQLFGLAQSGLPDLRIAHIIKDIDILIEARHDVDDYIKSVGIESLRTYVDDELKERFGSKFLRILYS